MKLHAAILKTEEVAWLGTTWGKTALRYAIDLYNFVGGEPRLDDVTTDILDKWIAIQDESPSTTNRRLAAVSKVFGVAKQRGYTGPVPYMPRKKEPPHRVRFLTRDEESALARKLIRQDERAWEIMILLLDTGMRMSELYRLRVADLNWTTGMFTITQSKGGRPRSIPMTTRVRDILNSPDPKLPVSLNQTAFRKYWDVARAEMGLTDDPCFVPHVLRHTCASRLVQNNVPLKVVQEWLGHAGIQMTMRYAHLAPENLEAASAALEKYNDQ